MGPEPDDLYLEQLEELAGLEATYTDEFGSEDGFEQGENL